jgi:hypothetical protein
MHVGHHRGGVAHRRSFLMNGNVAIFFFVGSEFQVLEERQIANALIHSNLCILAG